MNCQHRNKIADNNGMTCLDCGATLAGYGYFAEGSRECKHEWQPISQDGSGYVCVYCESFSKTPMIRCDAL